MQPHPVGRVMDRPRIVCRFPPIRRRDLCPVRFVNKTPFDVQLARMHCQMIIEPGCHMDMDIYKSSWFARKSTTKDDLCINGKKVFIPVEPNPINKNQGNTEDTIDTSQRLVLPITVPLRTLKYASMLCIKNSIKNAEDVSTLDLPKSLIGEIEQLVKQRNDYQNGLDIGFDSEFL